MVVAIARFLAVAAPGVKRGFVKKPIRATAAKEAGQGMSTEETAVRPDQILYGCE